jgi:hypothetical protein
MGKRYTSADTMTILTIDPATDEADLRRTLANTIKGGYHLMVSRHGLPTQVYRVGVVEQRDIDTVLAAFDVIDRTSDRWLGGKPVWEL